MSQKINSRAFWWYSFVSFISVWNDEILLNKSKGIEKIWGWRTAQFHKLINPSLWIYHWAVERFFKSGFRPNGSGGLSSYCKVLTLLAELILMSNKEHLLVGEQKTGKSKFTAIPGKELLIEVVGFVNLTATKKVL